MIELAGRPVWAEVSLGNISHNFRELKRLVGPDVSVMAIVKANAYGHGAKEVAGLLAREGADWFGVAVPEEAFELRAQGLSQPILVLSHTPASSMAEAILQGISMTLYSSRQVPDLLRAAQKVGKPARVHVKVDTGMGRLGFNAGRAGVEEILSALDHPELKGEGIFTHFACADQADKTFTEIQYQSFTNLVELLEDRGRSFPFKHAANSAAVIDLPRTHFNLVRPGISLYGIYPSDEVRRDAVELRPAMALKARIAFVKEVPENTGISYGRTFVTGRPSLIATLPLGYADGYSRLLSNRGEVLIGGSRAPVAGRVCMDQTLIDVTGVQGAVEGREVVLFGTQPEGAIPVEEIAERMGTITYEVLCLVGERVPRYYI